MSQIINHVQDNFQHPYAEVSAFFFISKENPSHSSSKNMSIQLLQQCNALPPNSFHNFGMQLNNYNPDY